MNKPGFTTLRAFSLIEATIVLGVVALVMGALWVAASKTQERLSINRTATAITQLAAGAQRLFKLSDYPTAAYTGSSGYLVMSPTAVAAGLVPSDMATATTFKLATGTDWFIQLIGPTSFGNNSILIGGTVTSTTLATQVLATVATSARKELQRAGCGVSNQSTAAITVNLNAPELIVCPSDSGGTRIFFYFRPG